MRFDRVLGLAGRTLLALTLGFLVVVACGPSTPDPPPDDAIEIAITTVGPGSVQQPGSSFTCRGTCTWIGAAEDATGFVAVPDAANAFVSWTGACDTLDATCTRLLSDGDATTATFAPHALRLRLTGDGEGEFRIQGPAVDIGCSEDCAVGVGQPLALAITYFAHGSSETVLGDWGGACAGADRLDYCLAPVDGATEVSKTWRRPPVAVDDAFGTTRNARLTVAATAGVLANDSDTPGDTLTAVLVTDAAHGTLDLAADGGFDYLPDPGYAGGDAFVYRVRDAFGNLSGSATATITVTNRPPVAAANSYVTPLNTPLDVPAPGVLANDGDPDGDALTIVAPTPVSDGTLVLEPDGGFTYTPEPNFIGLATFAYSVSDGLATSDAATVTIGVGLDAPVASDDAYATFRNQDLVVEEDAGILANDVDPAEEPLVAVLVDDVAEGTLVLAADGGFTYQPDAGFVGTDTFTYVASNGEDISVVAMVTITVTNRPPVASPDAYPMFRNGTLTVPAATGVLDDDTDPDGDPLTAVLVTPPASGTLNLAANGGFTYTPPAGATGPVTFAYAADDGIDESAPATVTITVTNRPPVADDDGPYATFRNQVLTVPAATGVLQGDTDPDGDPLTVTAVTQPTGGAGSVTVNANGSFTYTPTTGYTGTTTFGYTASDGLATATATVTITVTNRPPVADNDTYPMFRNGTLTVPAATGVLDGDTDPDNDPLTAVLITPPASGTLTLNPNGSFTYTPPTGTTGPVTFTYAADDGIDESAPATVTININNRPPTAVDDTAYETAADTPLVVPAPGVLGNDSDPDGDPLTASVFSQPTDGVVTVNADGSFQYEPDPGFSGTDGFTYTASDGLAGSTANVTITVIGP